VSDVSAGDTNPTADPSSFTPRDPELVQPAGQTQPRLVRNPSENPVGYSD
jgi:hypothetical protein